MYENHTDHISNNLRLNEISIIVFLPILFQNKQKLIRNSSKRTYELHPNKHLKSNILSIKPSDEVFQALFKFRRRG